MLRSQPGPACRQLIRVHRHAYAGGSTRFFEYNLDADYLPVWLQVRLDVGVLRRYLFPPYSGRRLFRQPAAVYGCGPS